RRADLRVEPLLQLERPPVRPLARWVEAWRGGAGLQVVDDAVRADHDLAPDPQHRHLRLPRQPGDGKHVRARKIRASRVRYTLDVERPARLLVEVGKAELMELWSHRSSSGPGAVGYETGV